MIKSNKKIISINKKILDIDKKIALLSSTKQALEEEKKSIENTIILETYQQKNIPFDEFIELMNSKNN